MRTLLSERFAPITSAIGFLEASIENVSEELAAWRRSLGAAVSVSHPPDGFPEVLRRLEPLTGGIRPRELLVSAGDWTAYFDCGLRGTDAVSTMGHLSRQLRCQGLAVRTVPRTVGVAGISSGRMGSVQFELFGPIDTDFLNYVRTISVSHTGSKWRFDANGTEQTFEETDAYSARRVRDRFTSAMLERYCQAMGIDVFRPEFYGPEATLVESDLPPAPGGMVMTLAEVQEWLEIVPGMADDLPG